MRIGTNHFKNATAAVMYYRAQGFEDAVRAVRDARARGDIALGPPLLCEAGRVRLDSDNRYYIVEADKEPHAITCLWCHVRFPAMEAYKAHQIPDPTNARVWTCAKAKAPDAPQGATRGQLVNRSLKAAGGFPAAKGWRVMGYSWGTRRYDVESGGRKEYRITAQVSRAGAHHLTGRVYDRVIAKGPTFQAALEAAVKRIHALRSKAK